MAFVVVQGVGGDDGLAGMTQGGGEGRGRRAMSLSTVPHRASTRQTAWRGLREQRHGAGCRRGAVVPSIGVPVQAAELYPRFGRTDRVHPGQFRGGQVMHLDRVVEVAGVEGSGGRGVEQPGWSISVRWAGSSTAFHVSRARAKCVRLRRRHPHRVLVGRRPRTKPEPEERRWRPTSDGRSRPAGRGVAIGGWWPDGHELALVRRASVRPRRPRARVRGGTEPRRRRAPTATR